MRTCPDCHGDGYIVEHIIYSQEEDDWCERRCPTCGGEGHIDS